MVALVLFLSSFVMAVLAYYFPKMRLFGASTSIIVMAVCSGFLAADIPYGFGLGFLLFSLFQVLNIARLISDRLHSKRLKLAFFVGGGRLFVMQVAIYSLGWITNTYVWVSDFWDIALPVAQLFIATTVLGLVIHRLIKATPKNIETFLSDHELPTVSVLIPARNEDKDLTEVLKSVVASDYPKLEILVLDDCSTSGHIPEIVKEFAHDGVRFIGGEEPKENWLAKNQAYETLAGNASGEWLIFMGVDVRLGTGSVRSLVHYAVNNHKSMLSILPHRQGGAYWLGFFSPLRYLREMLKVSIVVRHEPALSTLWLISKESYLSQGGIESVAQKVIPEHYFANKLGIFGQYAFVRTNDQLQVTTAKSLKEQISTSIRVIYPGFHGRMEWSALSSFMALLLLFAPFVQAVYYASHGVTTLAVAYGLVVVMLSCAHLLITIFTNPVLWPLAIINLPFLLVQEVVLGFVSLYRYEFGKVYWKERNICLPVMQVIPRLPEA